MRLDVRIRKVEEKINTTKFEVFSECLTTKNFFVNTEAVSSLSFDTKVMILNVSGEPFADGEVALAFPPVPFFKEFTEVVRYEHRIKRKGKERTAPNTPELGVTQAYVGKADLEAQFIAERKPIHFGLSPVTGLSVEVEEQASAANIGIGDEIDRAGVLAAFDSFLRESVRVQKEGRLTSRQIWAVWAARRDTDPDERVIADVKFADVARRFRAVFGATAAKNPTRIDGRLQRYWSGYAI